MRREIGWKASKTNNGVTQHDKHKYETERRNITEN
jgi:hypothetical protein